MYIQMISIHGLVRGRDIEMGRDADTGGQVRYVLELVRELAQSEKVTQVDLFTRQIKDKRVSPDYGKHFEKLGPKCRIVRLPCGGNKYLRKERLWPHLDDFVDAMITFTQRENLKPAIVHGHYADAGYIARQVASTFGVPFVFTGHSLGRDKLEYLLNSGWKEDDADKEFNIRRRIKAEEESLAVADLVVTSTRHERDNQYSRYDAGEDTRFEVIPPGIDLDRFFPYYNYTLPGQEIEERQKQSQVRMLKELQRFHFQPDKPLILSLCRPDKRKNIDALVKAYGEDRELQALANLAVFAGIREDVAEMEDAQRKVLTDILLLMDRYDLYGKMAIPKQHESERDVPELYRLTAAKHGIFVNAAFVEPFGLTFIEASAAGCPFVGTHNGGPQDIVENCDCGLLVDVTDTTELAEAMKKLLTDGDLWEKCSSNGINKVREHYSWRAHSDRYLECLEELTRMGAGKSVFTAGKGDIPLGTRLSQVESLLITDIDNTLLGDKDALEQLRELIHDKRDRMGFGVASGRYLEKSVEVLHDNGIEVIDIIVSSVGTEIYYGPELVPDRGWASHLRAKWRPDRIREALDPLPFITLQADEKTQREFKISYDLDSNVSSEEALPLMHDALTKARVAYNLIFSHGAYIDILPHRASKGKAIRYLSGKWDIPLRNIATAGDSGNDAEMLVGDTAGIVVGNYDKELEPLRSSSARVYFAEAEYAAGILEGLKHYQFI